MPLNHSGTKAAFNSNVKTLMGEVGKSPHVQSRAQAVAVAYSEKDHPKGRALGGVAPQMMNPGGVMSQAFNSTMPQMGTNAQSAGVMPSPALPSGLQNPAGSPGLGAARGFSSGGGVASPHPLPVDNHSQTFKGPIVSSVPGRTDLHGTHVPSGSFVIPADIVSGHGQGNTIAGMHALQKLFKMGPHSAGNLSSMGKLHKLARGGSANEHVGKPVPVKLAGGEIVVPPENVHETMNRICKKSLTLDECHRAMDQWVLSQRKKLRKTLAALPGPAKD